MRQVGAELVECRRAGDDLAGSSARLVACPKEVTCQWQQ
jgi:hypothetical protein